MKVVNFCGGEGLRLRQHAPNTPKPMVPIGSRPILWHLMRYYAHYGHRDFILCLGHQSDVIENYFAHHNDGPAGRVAGSRHARQIDFLAPDAGRWSITFADTGPHATIGMRLRAVRHLLDREEVFLANYADGLTDAALPRMIEALVSRRHLASFLSVRPSQSFHVVSTAPDLSVRALTSAASADIWINGGFFVFRRGIFDYLRAGEDLVLAPFQRLIERHQLVTCRHTGFWACMDTFKDWMLLEERYARGDAPWEVWREPSALALSRAGEP